MHIYWLLSIFQGYLGVELYDRIVYLFIDVNLGLFAYA